MTTSPARRVELFAALAVAFAETHPFADFWPQSCADAADKRRHGHELVRRADGKPVDPVYPLTGGAVCTTSQFGRRAATRHVVSYAATQTAVAVLVTRALGHRVPWHAHLAGAVINAATHWLIDRGPLLEWLAGRLNRAEFIDRATVLRRPNGPAERYGPGTGWLALDDSLHRLIGLFAALGATLLATRAR